MPSSDDVKVTHQDQQIDPRTTHAYQSHGGRSSFGYDQWVGDAQHLGPRSLGARPPPEHPTGLSRMFLGA